MTTEIAKTNQNAGLTKPEPGPKQRLAQFLEENKGALIQAMPKSLTADRVLRVAMSAVNKNPDLLGCSQASFMQCVMHSVQLGLEPGSPLGHAYLVPFKAECTLIVGYRGLIELAQRGGVKKIWARVVYENDFFEVEFGIEDTIRHRPTLKDALGPMIAVYAIATFDNGVQQFEVMTRSQVDAIRKRSRTGHNGPWVTDYDEMAKKSVTRRLCKYLPLSIESQDAIAKANALEDGEDEPINIDPPRSRLAAKIEATAELDDSPLTPPPPDNDPPPPPPPPVVHQAEFSTEQRTPQAFNLKPPAPAPAEPPPVFNDRTASDEEIATICKNIFGCANDKDLADLRKDLEDRRAAKTLNLTKDQANRIRTSIDSKTNSLKASQAAK